MRAERFTAEPIMAQLKDFQRRTVDYVYERFYGVEPIRRFLVADEVGLGKTLVARGVIARAIEHLQDSVDRIDIIYVCSNANIAKQNINRLNVSGKNSFALATRLTLLPTKISKLSKNFQNIENSQPKINMVSFTPGTTFDLKRRAGLAEERALIFRMLSAEPWNVGRGLYNFMQATVTNRNNWGKWVTDWTGDIDPGLAHAFRDRVSVDEHLIRRLNSCCEKFRRLRKHVPDIDSKEQYQLIGELRHLLAETCLYALEPDLVILDEFQRFKNLLDGDNDAASLARVLFNYPDVRTLLLSATPYKMLSLDHEQDDDHYPDFLRTLSFLFDNGLEVAQIEGDIQKFRRGLFALTGSHIAELEGVRNRLQSNMLRVMCRTERVGMTQKLDAMLIEPFKQAPLHPHDLDQAFLVDRASRALGARESIDYWKSSPYLLNFLKHYELRRKLDAVAEAPPADLMEVLKKADNQILQSKIFERYLPIDPGNARLRLLFHEMLDLGLWRLLWMPPSLPYVQPAGVYADIGSITKALVFSAWNLVPDAIAALCSYEAERRMLEDLGHDWSHSQLYDRVKPLLRFAKGRDDRLTGMPALAWLMPSPTLAATIDPLEIALRKGNESPIPINLLITEVENYCDELLKKLPAGGPGTRPDERWYWVAPALLEAQSQLRQWCLAERGWIAIGAGHEPGTRFSDHVNLLVSALDGELELGPRPGDLPKVMAELALAGPGTCALRALRRIAPELPPDDLDLLSAAARVAGGFRTLFNLPETICLLRGSGEDTYWRLSLRYGIEGNIQALLDEQVHVLLESLGLVHHPPEARVAGIAESLANALSIRTAQIRIDELALEEEAIKIGYFNSRCRFALRFGEIKDERDATLARAEVVREAFNSPFRPFILASTSIGQEGLDFHTWCHAVIHWNLPSNPVDLEQREGRVQRYKGHAIRKNIAKRFGIAALSSWDRKGDPWAFLFQRAAESKPTGASDLVPYWIYEVEEGANIERLVPLLPFSREVQQLDRLKRSLVLYRLVFGQPRQEDLLAHLADRMSLDEAESVANAWRISLEPPI
jgi:hypothetical protein